MEEVPLRPMLVGWVFESRMQGPADGLVTYVLAEEDGSVTLMEQPFRRGAPCYVGKEPVWGWDGDEVAPTLSPSFWCRDPRSGTMLHLYLLRGGVELLQDSEAVLGVAEPAIRRLEELEALARSRSELRTPARTPLQDPHGDEGLGVAGEHRQGSNYGHLDADVRTTGRGAWARRAV